MSDLEALLWVLENDPHLSATFANLTALDQPLDIVRLRSRMARALPMIPRLRQRVVPGLGRLSPPEWRSDREIDLDWHVRRVRLPAPGTKRALLDLAAELAADPFDRSRPLWRFTVIEGLEGGRAAMVQQIHHALTDGEGMVRMSLEFLDFDREAPEPAPVEASAPEDPPADDLLTAAAGALGHLAWRGLDIVSRTVGQSAELLRHPERLAQLAETSGETALAVARQAVVTDHARSPLWSRRTLARRLDVLRVPLGDVQRAAKALGGSVNDLFVAAVAGGAGTYHRDRGHDIGELRMAMPVSTREGETAAGNAFAVTRTLVSTAADPRERFEAIRASLAITKAGPTPRLMQSAAGITNLLPASLVVRAARQQAETVDFTTSNVRGAPVDTFIAGARIEANYPLGPVAGTAFNATMVSGPGSLDIGVNSDSGAVEDPAALRDAIAAGFDELLDL